MPSEALVNLEYILFPIFSFSLSSPAQAFGTVYIFYHNIGFCSRLLLTLVESSVVRIRVAAEALSFLASYEECVLLFLLTFSGLNNRQRPRHWPLRPLLILLAPLPGISSF